MARRAEHPEHQVNVYLALQPQTVAIWRFDCRRYGRVKWYSPKPKSLRRLLRVLDWHVINLTSDPQFVALTTDLFRLPKPRSH